MHIYIREKIASIAIMRCLGVRSAQAFIIYLMQILAIGLVGSVIGAALGSAIQYAMPHVFKDFLPLTVSTAVSWAAIGQGVLLGMIISVLFALLPLIAIRNISPLNTLRMSYDNINLMRDPLRWLVYLLIGGFIVLFTKFQLDSWKGSVAFTIGILIAFFILTLIARGLMILARLIIRNSWSYLWRQGFANLYRPNNQTIILIVSIGLSTTFICTLFFIQNILVKQVSLSATSNSANMILFDIQPAQKQALAATTKSQHLPVIQQVPVVTMRMATINGKTESIYKKDTTLKIPARIFANEYRATYRDTLVPTEKVIEGDWTGKAISGKDVAISLEDRFAKHNHLKVGDHIAFNVQGSPIPTVVTSIRQVNWNKMQTNFLVVFPKGVLEDAPQFYAMLTHVGSDKISAKYQQTVVKQFPNISIIDLGQLLSVLDELLDKLGDIIKFMSAFSIITGIVVLIASVRISKYQRIRESVLLRTMGASRKQILTITALEYIFLGGLSALTGILIAMTGSWFLAKFSFDIPFTVSIVPAAVIFVIITGLTVVIGLLNSRGILNRPPLEILRGDD
ncbi:ABC transporter permease [Mucilaginibacter ginkgonis]|uniref:ABC transporter permease n=1 Tax=Mucilaginibacter ginkgonis TaxID=2682091 RepID=UPI003743EF3A